MEISVAVTTSDFDSDNTGSNPVSPTNMVIVEELVDSPDCESGASVGSSPIFHPNVHINVMFTNTRTELKCEQSVHYFQGFIDNEQEKVGNTYASMSKMVKLAGLDPVEHIGNIVGSNPTRGTKFINI